MEGLKEAGIDSMALSLDASTAKQHDAIRNVPGTYAKTLEAAWWAEVLNIPLQINTLVAEETVDDLPAIYELLKDLKVMRWSLFFLIAVGRGKQLNEISAERGEELMEWLLDLSLRAPFQVKTTESPSFRRVAQSRMKDQPVTPGAGTQSIRRAYGIRDGNGIVFVSHIGEVYPSGFLPVRAGNVRKQSLVDIYRDSEVFTTVRDVVALKGKCGRCEFRKVCGGSRARAFAHTGDLLESDPLCVYQPEDRAVAISA
jgi:radical SAM protein with 4Fe4S-binding SPASM domain